ncbi:hypothetical protein Purlil1_14225 [Purpureocillium lilacinum]|uniref:Uncharacterized protein n=1 Tax=Purpureocillium lilacinum TaxID=33203 RepID=A0ABR0BBW0_PURLI|nr:hypothetical protein Purlil1_14225 [Purpureocillium lilacinum]
MYPMAGGVGRIVSHFVLHREAGWGESGTDGQDMSKYVFWRGEMYTPRIRNASPCLPNSTECLQLHGSRQQQQTHSPGSGDDADPLEGDQMAALAGRQILVRREGLVILLERGPGGASRVSAFCAAPRRVVGEVDCTFACSHSPWTWQSWCLGSSHSRTLGLRLLRSRRADGSGTAQGERVGSWRQALDQDDGDVQAYQGIMASGRMARTYRGFEDLWSTPSISAGQCNNKPQRSNGSAVITAKACVSVIVAMQSHRVKLNSSRIQFQAPSLPPPPDSHHSRSGSAIGDSGGPKKWGGGPALRRVTRLVDLQAGWWWCLDYDFIQCTCEHGAHQFLKSADCEEDIKKIQDGWMSCWGFPERVGTRAARGARAGHEA